MQNSNNFNTHPDFKSAVASILAALGRRDRVEPRGPFWSMAIVLSLVVFLASVLFYSYPREAEKREIMAVPIIRADAGPYKVIPNDPGGMDIPHRDSTVFETLRAARESDDGIRQVENLLPESEEPMTREQIFAGLRTELKVEGKEIIKAKERPQDRTEDKPQPVVDISEPVAVAKVEETEPVIEEQTIAVAVPVPSAKPVLEDAEKFSRTEPAAGVETYQATPSIVSGYYVQFASLRTQVAAQDAWKDLQKSLSFLRSLEHKVKRADLGSQGIYYRLQAGPFDQARAREICKAVEVQRPGGCFVVKN